MADSLGGRRNKGAMSKRAALRRRTLEDYTPPETLGSHGILEDLVMMGLPAGGAGGLLNEVKPAAAVAGQVVRGAQRRVATRAAAAASERRLAEMAAPRATRTFAARGKTLISDVLGTPTDPMSVFSEAEAATQALHDALLKQLLKQGGGG